MTGVWNYCERYLIKIKVCIFHFMSYFMTTFVPDTTRHWNSLNLDVRYETSVSKIKMVISWFLQHSKSSIFFLVLCLVHVKASKILYIQSYDCILHYDLYKINITESGKCLCGLPEYVYCVCLWMFGWVCYILVTEKNQLQHQKLLIEI